MGSVHVPPAIELAVLTAMLVAEANRSAAVAAAYLLALQEYDQFLTTAAA